MKALRSIGIFLFIFIASTSLVYDWADVVFKSATDTYEDVYLVHQTEITPYNFVKTTVNWTISTSSATTKTLDFISKSTPNVVLQHVDKVRIYLHLLKLF